LPSLRYFSLIFCSEIIAFLTKLSFVTVPPAKPVIFDAKRRDRTKLLEPYNEGTDVHLICEVTGGKSQNAVDAILSKLERAPLRIFTDNN
jgi:hypothetical protein